MTTTNTPRKEIRAAAYGRVSTDNQDVELSLAAQFRNIRRLAGARGIVELDEYDDRAISGHTTERPGFRELMMKALSPEKPYDLIFVEDLTRLMRSLNDYVSYEQIFAEHGIELISVMEPSSSRNKIDTSRRIKMVMAEDFLQNVAERTRDSQFLAVEMGFHIGATPLGFKKEKVFWKDKEHIKLVPDPEHWDDLLWLIDMAKRDYTLGELIEELEKAEVKRPDGRDWNRENLSYMLLHHALLGWTTRGWRSGTKSPFLYPTDPVICKTAHQAAMTEEERDLIIQNLAKRRRTVKNPRTNRSKNPLGEKVFCGICGSTMTIQSDYRYVKLVCSSNRKGRNVSVDGIRQKCPNKRVKLDILLECLLDAIMNHILTEKVLRQQVKMVALENKDAVAAQEARRKQIDRRLKVLEKELGNMADGIAAYGPGSKTLENGIKKREGEQENLETEIQRIRQETGDILDFISDPQRTIANALDLRTYLETEDPHDLKRMLNHLIQRVSIVEKVVTVDYLIPLPKNGTGEPILSEEVYLEAKKRPSVGDVGVRWGIHPPNPLDRAVLWRTDSLSRGNGDELGTMTGFATLKYSKHGRVARISLNRPEVLNAFNIQMRDDVWEALAAVEDDPDVGALLITGEGRAFCAGADLTEFGSAPSPVIARDVRWERDVWGRWYGLSKPVVVAVHGYCIGSGLEMALLSDLRLRQPGQRLYLESTRIARAENAGRAIGPEGTVGSGPVVPGPRGQGHLLRTAGIAAGPAVPRRRFR